MTKTTSKLSCDEMDAMIRRVLDEIEEPLALSRIRIALPRAYRPTEEELARRLRALCASGAVHRWPRGRFGARTPEASATDAILGALVDRPLTVADLTRIVTRRLKGIGEKPIAAALKALVAEKRLCRHPPSPRGRSPRFGLTAPDPADYLEPGLSRLVAEIVKKGFPPESVRAAMARAVGGPASPAAHAAALSDEDAILAEMKRLEPQATQGALVYIPHVRQGLAGRFSDKLAFDRAVLALAAQRRVQVQTHPVPSQLTEAEREAMVPNGVGGYYIAIGLRAE